MTGAYALTSIGIEARITNGVQLTFNAYVYDDQGNVGVNPLAVGPNTTVTGTGNIQFYDLPISFTLLSGQSYDIGIDFHSINNGNLAVHYYGFDAPSSFSVSPFTVVDGEESHNGPANTFAPNLRLNSSVPEPGSVVLLATGALVLFGARFRRRR